MNFLAHALLAGEAPALIVGGVVGDWIKGPLPGALPADLARGVALHRAVDRFAESQDAFRASRARISAPRRRYAGVLVDIFYDHLLARDFAALHGASLGTFTARVYALIGERLAELPEAARPALQAMAREDWLASYAGVDGMAAILVRMARRARRPNPLAGGEMEFLTAPGDYAADFTAWLAEARTFAGAWRCAHL